MKKIFIAIIALLCLTGCTSKIKYTQVSYSDLENKINNKESFVLVIGSSTCSNCVIFKQTVENTQVNKRLEMFYIYIDSLSDEDYAKLYSKYAVSSTPTTIFFKDGAESSIYNRIIGRVSSTELKDSLKEHGYLGD